jgi:hypothetical protein
MAETEGRVEEPVTKRPREAPTASEFETLEQRRRRKFEEAFEAADAQAKQSLREVVDLVEKSGFESAEIAGSPNLPVRMLELLGYGVWHVSMPKALFGKDKSYYVIQDADRPDPRGGHRIRARV